MLASIPSPANATLQIGPLELHYYGILIAIGVAIAFSITRRRFVRFGGDIEPLDRVMVWGVLIGFLGGRFGYVLTHLDTFFGENARLAPWQVLAIWEGGLAFYGGVFFGTIASYVMLKLTKQPILAFFDAVAIAVPVAQAVGRLGNWFNQELFGSPTDLPWGLAIEERFRPNGLGSFATFHPTFLYELLLNLLAVVVMLWLEKKREYKRGSIFLVYLMLYGVIRFLMELLRADEQIQWLGLGIRNNGLIAIFVFLVAGAVLLGRETGKGDILAKIMARDELVLVELATARRGATGDDIDAALVTADLEGEPRPPAHATPDASADDTPETPSPPA